MRQALVALAGGWWLLLAAGVAPAQESAAPASLESPSGTAWLKATLYPRTGVLLVGNGGARLVEASPDGSLLIDAGAPLPRDAAARLAPLRPYLAGMSAEGALLRLRLAPGIRVAKNRLNTGELSIALHPRAGRKPPRAETAPGRPPAASPPPVPRRKPASAAPAVPEPEPPAQLPVEPAAGPAPEPPAARRPETPRRPAALVAPEPDAPASAPPAEAKHAPESSPEPPAPLPVEPFGLTAFKESTAAERQVRRSDLVARLPRLEALPQALARLDLARLYLADGRAPEARAALERIDAAALAGPEAEAVARARAALGAAAAALAGEPGEALAALAKDDLRDDPEAALWRAFAAARVGRHAEVGAAWARGREPLAAYPAPLRRSLGRGIAASLVQRGDPREARALLDLLRPLETEPEALAELQLLRGLVATRTRQPVIAEQALLAAGADGDPVTKVKAAYLAVIARHEQGKLDAAEAAAELAAQRARWPGHPWEARMRRQLAAFHALAGDPLAALAAAIEARDAAGGPEADAEAASRLLEVLRAAGEGQVPAVTAAAIHRTHGALLDGDPRAAEPRRALALRVAEAGLPEEALEILRRAGPAAPGDAVAARARLAAAQALAARGEAEAALAALGEAGEATDDAAVFRAQVAVAKGEARAALAVLGSAPGAEADRLRREARLRLGDWEGLAAAGEAALQRAGADGPLDPEAAADLVGLALAKAWLGEPGAGADLAGRLGDRLPDGPWRPLLGLIGAVAIAPGSAEEAPAAAAALAETVRRELGLLDPPAGAAGAEAAAAELRSESARSGPGG